MNVNLDHREDGSTPDRLQRLLPSAAASEHSDWLDFLQRNDGAVPETNEFDVSGAAGSGVQAFFGAEQSVAAHRRLGDRMPGHLFPVAEAEGGNYVCLGLTPGTGGVFFWDHETEEATRIAASFSAFQDGLRPFDPDSVELAEGQVVSAWIDPAFLASLGNQD